MILRAARSTRGDGNEAALEPVSGQFAQTGGELFEVRSFDEKGVGAPTIEFGELAGIGAASEDGDAELLKLRLRTDPFDQLFAGHSGQVQIGENGQGEGEGFAVRESAKALKVSNRLIGSGTGDQSGVTTGLAHRDGKEQGIVVVVLDEKDGFPAGHNA